MLDNGLPSVESSSDDENRNRSVCPHVGKAVDSNSVRKALKRSGFLSDCEQCKRLSCQQEDEDSAMNGLEFDQSLWLCLKCGHQACGRTKNGHALHHHEVPHSDSHAVCINTTFWSIWCYECDNEINLLTARKLMDVVEMLKKMFDQQNYVGPLKPLKSAPVIIASEVDLFVKNQISSSVASSSGATRRFISNLSTRARGLSNLGNTCFFNSVMQCLCQTPYLLTLLEETGNSGQCFHLPGGQLKLIEDKKEKIIDLPALDGKLGEWKPLTGALAETLRELQNGRIEVYNPQRLHTCLISIMPQFGGGDQHDSHELLRHLLEAVREDDLKRYKAMILDKMGYNLKTNPSNVEEDKKKIIKFYGQQASEMLPTEQVFRGVLVSTLKCETCGHMSHREEYFLDLSLPICEKQVPPALRRKAEDLHDDSKMSKHQIKKEKRAEKKNKKKKSHRNFSLNINQSWSTNSMDGTIQMDKSESESDADVEDNAEDSNGALPREETPKGMESGYNSDKIDNSSPDSNNRAGDCSPEMRIDDSGVPSPTIGVSPASPDNSPASSETNVDMGSPLFGHNSPNDELEDFERPASRLAFVNTKTDLKEDLAKLSLLGEDGTLSFNVEMEDGAYGGPHDNDEKMEEDEDDSMNACHGNSALEEARFWSNTLAPRYQCEEGECSVQSCLNQFTECELLIGDNRVACESCTLKHGGPLKKTVNTDASKQLLIYNPPAVLILHLKRFQVYRFRSTKVVKHVKFSTLLDLAPFCSKRSQTLPTFRCGQTQALYSLYGVVEHSGSIHGGHYVAYIKVRPKIDQNNPRWSFLPKNQACHPQPQPPQNPPEIPPGKWYYISDSHVAEVTESKVLDTQAYLLFYERIV